MEITLTFYREFIVLYIVEYRLDPQTIRLRLMCCHGKMYHMIRSEKEVTNDVRYHYLLREWFSHGVSQIELFQYSGFLIIELKKDSDKDWDKILEDTVGKREFWEEISPRITNPRTTWPYEDIVMGVRYSPV